jgi:hypothetical protein
MTGQDHGAAPVVVGVPAEIDMVNAEGVRDLARRGRSAGGRDGGSGSDEHYVLRFVGFPRAGRGSEEARSPRQASYGAGHRSIYGTAPESPGDELPAPGVHRSTRNTLGKQTAQATRSAASCSSVVRSFLILFVTPSSVAVITVPFPAALHVRRSGPKHHSSRQSQRRIFARAVVSCSRRP